MANLIRIPFRILCFFSCINVLLAQCGQQTLTANESIQFLRSPNYPENYPEGLNCKWTISTDGGPSKNDGIHLHIENYVLEDSDKCDVDYLAIIDKGANFDKIPLCAGGKTFDYYSEASEVTLNFVSSSDATKKGWKPPYSLEKDKATPVASSEKPKKRFQLEYSLPTCTRNFTGPWGQIKQTLFKDDSHCFMTVSAPSSNHTVSLYFWKFHLNALEDKECNKNYLEVRDGPTGESPLIGKFCGDSIPDSIFSSGQHLWLHVKTEHGNNNTVDITYMTTDKGKGCGGRLNAASGVFTSPKHPQNYKERYLCKWDINTPANLVAEYTFISFDMGSKNTCETDYIEILDYNDIIDKLTSRGKFCSGSQPTVIRTKTNYSIVKYMTSGSNEGAGWKLFFKSVPEE